MVVARPPHYVPRDYSTVLGRAAPKCLAYVKEKKSFGWGFEEAAKPHSSGIRMIVPFWVQKNLFKTHIRIVSMGTTWRSDWLTLNYLWVIPLFNSFVWRCHSLYWLPFLHVLDHLLDTVYLCIKEWASQQVSLLGGICWCTLLHNQGCNHSYTWKILDYYISEHQWLC